MVASHELGKVNSVKLELTRDLTHFQTMFHFYTPYKHQKTSDGTLFENGVDYLLIIQIELELILTWKETGKIILCITAEDN